VAHVDSEMSFWTHRNVFVSGASGLLGSSLVERLVKEGANVIALVRDWVPASRFVDEGFAARVTVARGELEDHATLLRIINEYEVDSVFHLGAQTIVGTAARSASSTFEANVRGTWNLLEACRAMNGMVERVIVASSDKAYGSHERLPYTEDMPLQGRFPYDVSKSCADLIAQSYYHSYRVPVAVTRCGNLYGPGDLNFSRLIPGTIRSALHGEPPIIRSDGRYVREYFYVRDAVGAYLRLAEALPDSPCVGEAFNFGTDQPLEVIELTNRILQLMDCSHLTPTILNQASREIRSQYLDCSKARRMLGWQPAYTLDEALLETIAWYRQREHPQVPTAADALPLGTF
jgi:CDP-glucose 4,6-dehydratase